MRDAFATTLSNHQGLDARTDARGLLQFDAVEIVLALQIEPELRAHAKEGSEGEGGFGVDWTFAFDDFINGGTWNAGALR